MSDFKSAMRVTTGSGSLHDHEVLLVFQSDSGKILPSKRYERLAVEASRLSPAHAFALLDQARRQVEALTPRSPTQGVFPSLSHTPE